MFYLNVTDYRRENTNSRIVSSLGKKVHFVKLLYRQSDPAGKLSNCSIVSSSFAPLCLFSFLVDLSDTNEVQFGMFRGHVNVQSE